MPKALPTKIIGYRRTSTDDQLLGIDAQDERINSIARDKKCTIEKVFTEHESGGVNVRPELDKAIRLARRLQAYLVVAKLDRLSRDAGFLLALTEGNVPIIFGDLPELDLTSSVGRANLLMMATFAEFERRRIGERTREALKVLKSRGVKLGAARPECRNLTQAARLKGARRAAAERTARAIDEQSDIAAIASEKRSQGASLAAIATYLNEQGYPTREGKSWRPQQVKRILDRLKPPGGSQN
jgi:DNA invertase Pin-like site-specific DNA recombinase